MLDGNVLLRQKRDEVPEGTLSCPDRNLAVFHHYRHYEGLRLLPSVYDSKLIQQTLTTCIIENLPLCGVLYRPHQSPHNTARFSERFCYRVLLACGLRAVVESDSTQQHLHLLQVTPHPCGVRSI